MKQKVECKVTFPDAIYKFYGTVGCPAVAYEKAEVARFTRDSILIGTTSSPRDFYDKCRDEALKNYNQIETRYSVEGRIVE